MKWKLDNLLYVMINPYCYIFDDPPSGQGLTI